MMLRGRPWKAVWLIVCIAVISPNYAFYDVKEDQSGDMWHSTITRKPHDKVNKISMHPAKRGDPINSRNQNDNASQVKGLRGSADASSNTENDAVSKAAIDMCYFNTMMAILGILVIVLNIMSTIEMKMETKDEFVKEATHTCMRHVSQISLVMLGFYIILHTDIANKLESLLSYFPEHLEVIDALLQISFFLLSFFIAFCAYVAISVSRMSKTMRKHDEADILTAAKEYDFVSRSYLGMLHGAVQKAKYIVTRMEFVDETKQHGVQTNTTNYFYDYMRASLIKVSMDFFKISRISFFIAIVVVFVLRFFPKLDLFNTITALIDFNAAFIIFLMMRLYYLELQLYPPELSQYILLKLNTCSIEENLQPAYKRYNRQNAQNTILQDQVSYHSTSNAHESIFWLKHRGPEVLKQLFETFIFCHILLVSIWAYQFKCQPLVAFRSYYDLIPLLLTLVVFVQVPMVLYSMVVVTRCGGMIDFALLHTVITSSKRDNSKHAAQLIDALAMESIRYNLEKGGEEHWKVLAAKRKTAPEPVVRQLALEWELIKNNEDRAELQQVSKYVTSEMPALINAQKRHLKDFIKLFMRSDGTTLNSEEFMVLAYVVKSIVTSPIGEHDLINLFEDKYQIPWKSPCGIQLSNIGTIISSLNLKWSISSQRHFLEFIGGGAFEGFSPEYLVKQLNLFQKACQDTYYRNVQ